MVQIANPDSTVTASTWQTESASSTLHPSINDGSNSTYITDTNFGSPGQCEVGLSDLTDPVSSSDHTIYISGMYVNFGPQSVTVYLYQGGSIRAQSSISLTNSFAGYSYTLNASEANSITDYTDLRFRFTAGSANYAIEVSHARFEVPDAASPPPPPPPPPSSNFIEISNAQFRIEGLTNLGG